MKRANCLWKRCLAGLVEDRQGNVRAIAFKLAPLAFAALCLLSPDRAEGQAGALDMTFAPRIAAPTDNVGAAVLQPDGNLIVTGFFRMVGATLLGPDTTHTVRLNPDGTLDPSFHAAAVGSPT